MSELKLNATLREGLGKNKVNKLRAEKEIPAVIYGRGKDNLIIQVGERELRKAYESAGSSTIIDVVLDGTKYPVLFKEIQKHPFKNQFLHVDFQAINMAETIRLMIPITLIGRDDIRMDSPFIFMQGVNEIEIECLPGDIPETVECDVSNIDFDTPIFVKDLDLCKNEKVTILTDGEDVVASLAQPQEAEVETTDEEEASPTDVPVIGEEEEEE